jgi:hypothetical protein
MDTPKQSWVIQVCSLPGCCVDIRVKAGEQFEQPICTWHTQDRAYNTRPRSVLRPATGPTMTKEECGVDLYAAIQLQTAMRQAFTTAALFRDKGKGKAAEEAERLVVDLQKQLEAILKKNTIEPADLTRLLAIA